MSEPISLDQHEFIVTYTGRKFQLFRPRPEDIDIVDIAHALSMLCRFTGHCDRFYSVAEHCVNASLLVDSPFAFEALLHDASEAYINDLARPLKHHPSMSVYRDVEYGLESAIALRFRIPFPISHEVKHVDNLLVCSEAQQLMLNAEWAQGHPTVPGWIPECWDPRKARTQFLKRFQELY